MRRLTLLLLAIVASAHAQSPSLPAPTGSYPIGRQIFDWVDHSRKDPLAANPAQNHRELIVSIWYPAASRNKRARTAEYFPNAAEVNKDKTASATAHDIFGNAWPQIVSGNLRSHAIENAPIDENQRFPVVLFVHGYSASSFSYTAQIEDIVSHGYIVIAAEHTDAAGLVYYPNKTFRYFHPAPAPAGTTGVDAMIGSAMSATQTGVADLQFILDQLEKYATPLAGQMNPTRIAVVGHSYGGTVAARACQLESRIRACISEDGEVNPVGVYFNYPDAFPIRQPFLFIELPIHPTDENLAQMHQSREQWDAWHSAMQQQLHRASPGSFHAVVDLPGLHHNAFSDGPILNAATPELAAAATAHLRLLTSLTLGFLDLYLRDQYRDPAQRSADAKLFTTPAANLPTGLTISPLPAPSAK